MTTRDAPHELAIVGMACRFPGADSPRALWELVRSQKTMICDAPADRFDAELYYRDGPPTVAKSYSRRVGVIDYPDLAALRLPGAERWLARSDPAHALMCQLAREAAGDAGMAAEDLRRGRCGVYVGHSRGSEWIVDRASELATPDLLARLADFPEVAAMRTEEREPFLARLAHAIRVRSRAPEGLLGKRLDPHEAAALVTRVWGLTGPATVVYAACASSLQALWLAAQALRRGEIDSALVGGANYLRTAALIRLSQAKTLSSDEPRPLDAGADGMVVAEGYGLVLIKRLGDALRCGDRVLAIVRSLGAACDGRGKSFWAPRREGQTLAIGRAYDDRTRAGSIGYLEAHATGTVQGDATEVLALQEYFGGARSGEPLPIGSIKANIGHTLEAAGMAGLIKTVMALRHRVIPAQANLQTPSDALRGAAGVLAAPSAPRPWRASSTGEPRMGAVSSFGIGGLNLHTVLREPTADEQPPGSAGAGGRRGGGAGSRQAPRPPASEPLLVSGMGVILPGAVGRGAFRRLLEGPAAGARIAAGPVTDHPYDWRRHRIPPLQIERGNPLQYRVLEAIDQAVDHSGIDFDALGKARVGVVVGTSFDSDFSQSVQLGMRLPLVQAAIAAAGGLSGPDRDSLLRRVERLFTEELHVGLRDETGSSDASTLATQVTKAYDLMGGAMALDCGRGSSFAALAAAREMIASGQCDAVLCAAAERRLEHRRPPAGAASGTDGSAAVEAAAAVVLVGRQVASRHGLPGRVTIERIEVADPEAAVESAQARARRWADAGAATGMLDLLAAVLGPEPSGDQPRELLDFSGAGSGRRVVARPLEDRGRPTSAARSASAQPAARTRPPAERAWRLVRLGAPDLASLVRAIDTPAGSLESLYHSAGRPTFSRSDRYRLAAVADSPEDLAGKLTDARRRLAGGAASLTLHQAGVFVRPLPEIKPKVAFLFPGQASQYDQMLRSLVQSRSSAAEAMGRVDAEMERLGFLPFRELAWEDKDALSSDVWRSQMSLLMAAEILRAELSREGVTADVVSGHSFGEFPALVAVGAWSFESAARATHSRCVAIKLSSHSRGGMLASSAPDHVVEQVLQEMTQPAYVAGYNAPDQVVCGGPVDSLRFLAEVLELRGYASRLLDAPCPAHTPLMQDVREPLRRALRRVAIRPPRTPFLSSVSGRYEADPDRIRENLVEQLTQPVRYTDQVRRLADEGVTHFVEVGPGQVLTKLHHRILPDRRFLKVASDAKAADDRATGDGVRQLLAVVASLSVAGALEPRLWGDPWASSPPRKAPAARPARPTIKT